jgi:hypothetical protein
MKLKKLFTKFKLAVSKRWADQTNNLDTKSLVERISRLERNYLVLLKQVLKMDGVQLVTTKGSKFNNTVFQTVSDDHRLHGLNEQKPTIH